MHREPSSCIEFGTHVSAISCPSFAVLNNRNTEVFVMSRMQFTRNELRCADLEALGVSRRRPSSTMRRFEVRASSYASVERDEYAEHASMPLLWESIYYIIVKDTACFIAWLSPRRILVSESDFQSAPYWTVLYLIRHHQRQRAIFTAATLYRIRRTGT
jgi:hypothetical protein